MDGEAAVSDQMDPGMASELVPTFAFDRFSQALPQLGRTPVDVPDILLCE